MDYMPIDSILKTVLDSDFASLKDHVETMVSDGIRAKIENKKVDVLAALNGITREAQLDVMAVS